MQQALTALEVNLVEVHVAAGGLRVAQTSRDRIHKRLEAHSRAADARERVVKSLLNIRESETPRRAQKPG